MFAKNVGSTDKIIRLVLGIALVVLGLFISFGWISIAVGIILIATATVDFCPLYGLLKLSSRKKR